MLPQLPDTDLLRQVPDVEGLYIFAEGFGIHSVPRGLGVYCFYDPTTNEPKYIGSGCGRDTHGRKNCGLFLRIQLYRRPRHAHDLKIHRAVKDSGLLLKVWVAANEADARKYESDAIRLHMPALNVVGCVRESAEETRQRVNKHVRQMRLQRIARTTYDPDRVRICTDCARPKKCSEFRKCRGKTLHTHSTCRQCEAQVRKRERSASL